VVVVVGQRVHGRGRAHAAELREEVVVRHCLGSTGADYGMASRDEGSSFGWVT
jgi:hypothetical protein